LVISRTANFDQRQLIRDTWLQNIRKGHKMKVVFLVGSLVGIITSAKWHRIESKLIEENEKYNDIIVSNLIDSYHRLTYKVILGFQWVRKYCPSVKFIVKVDDDVFVNVNKLTDLSKMHEIGYNIIGPASPFSKVVRQKNNNLFYISKAEYSKNLYPQFAAGPFYVLTKAYALAISDYVVGKPLFKLEDVYITGIIANELNATKWLIKFDAEGGNQFLFKFDSIKTWIKSSNKLLCEMAPVAIILQVNYHYMKVINQKYDLIKMTCGGQNVSLSKG
jgi:hypothetical protein